MEFESAQPSIQEVEMSIRNVQAGADEDREAVTVDEPALTVRPTGDVTVTLGRFSDGSQLPFAELGAGQVARLEFPPDDSGVPWRIGFDGEGDVRVCFTRP